MKVTLTAVEGELEISSANDFRLVLGLGTSLTLEIKDNDFVLREAVTVSSGTTTKKKAAKVPPKKKSNLRIVK